VQVEVPGLGRVRCDIAFGGAFYAYVDARALGIPIRPESCTALIDAGMRIKQAVMDTCDIRHPDGDDDLAFLYGTIMFEPASGRIHSRNCCIFADGEVDRSPTGTGVSGRAALLHASGEIQTLERLTIESLIGTSFDVRVVETTSIGGMTGVIPEVWGSAHITGQHEFLIDPDDPLRDGILLR
jgi:trans-L-3-hydroxyproline dehydratase